MEVLSLQPMADREIDQVSGGVVPILVIGAVKVVGSIAGAAALTVATNYAYEAWRRYRNRSNSNACD